VTFSLIFVSQLQQEGTNDPAFILNIGTSANYVSGARNDIPGGSWMGYAGITQDRFGCGLVMQPDELLVLQMGNPGSFIIGFDIYEFTAT
jgi:hypothetical protein